MHYTYLDFIMVTITGICSKSFHWSKQAQLKLSVDGINQHIIWNLRGIVA